MIKPVTIAVLGLLLSAPAAVAQTVDPIDRAEILSGAQFDFKVEFPDKVDLAKLKVTLNGQDYAAAIGRAGTFVEREDGKDQSALLLRDSASAYSTGHKSAVNAMGVYADRTRDAFDDPRVETITSLAKRKLKMGIGIVTNTEIEDATPAAMVAHTRRL